MAASELNLKVPSDARVVQRETDLPISPSPHPFTEKGSGQNATKPIIMALQVDDLQVSSLHCFDSLIK